MDPHRSQKYQVDLNNSGDALVKLVERPRRQHLHTGCGSGPEHSVFRKDLGHLLCKSARGIFETNPYSLHSLGDG